MFKSAGFLRRIDEANERASMFKSSIQSPALPIEKPCPRRLRVLHVVDTLGMGGVETWLMGLLRFWRSNGDQAPQIDILATSGKPGLFDEEARALGADVFYARFGRSTLAGFAGAFRTLLKRGRYDAIHDHQGYVSGWHFLMGHGLLPPVRISHVHNPLLELHGRDAGRRLLAQFGKIQVARYATFIAGTSRQLLGEYGFDASRFIGIPKGALYCGIDTSRFIGDPAREKRSICQAFDWPEDARIILVVGRIDQSPDLDDPRNHKNSGFAVAAGIEAARRDNRVRALLVGEPSPAVPVLERRIAAARMEGRIRFAGIRRDIDRLMLGADVLLFPSTAEGLGMVAVEAQAAGARVLASTAVPQESIVVPELYEALPLHAPLAQWAESLVAAAARPRLDASVSRGVVGASVYGIANSARRLEAIYRSLRPTGC